MSASLEFVFGLIFLVSGACFLVEGAVAIADRLRVGSLTIGLTIVALGTSSPELAVNSVSAIRGATEIGIANVVGSNIFNVLAVLGLSSLVRHVRIGPTTVRYEIPMCVATAVILLFLVHTGVLTRVHGGMLIALFVVFLWYTVGSARSGQTAAPRRPGFPGRSSAALSVARATLYFLGGCVAVIAGGNWMVSAAVNLAGYFGVSQRIIGLTIVAVGTSLPEAATSLVAVARRETDLAVGNAVGSCVANIFLVLGVTAAITPIRFAPEIVADARMYFAGALLLLAVALLPRPGRIHRVEGLLMLLAYSTYIWYTVAGGSLS